MATVFPSKPIGKVPPTVVKTFLFLKELPDDFHVWHHLAPWQKDMPDFLVINPENQAIIVKVSNLNENQIESLFQMTLILDQNGDFITQDIKVLETFHELLIQCLTGTLTNSPDGNNYIRNIIICPNLNSKQINQNGLANKFKEIGWLGKEYLKSEDIEKWFGLFSSNPLDDIELHQLRALFTPEAVVPEAITIRKPIQRNLEAGLHDFLLDYDQELVLKTDLDLSYEADTLVRDFQTSLVNGVAGSGKTIILLYRLWLLFEMYPSKKFLVLTHNKPLIRDMQNKFYKLYGDLPSRIEWKTFYGFLYHNTPRNEWKEPVKNNHKTRIIRNIWKDFFIQTNITEGMLRTEINWINDQVDRSEESYMSAERRGRGFRLSEQQRKSMYDAYRSYCNCLKRKNLTDWGEIPHLVWELKKNNRTTLPIYDVLLIDEAQFFAPIWFEIILHIVQSQIGHLFIVADPTQGFLNRRISWKSMGLEVRGHSFALKRSYRTTQEILTLATIFYRNRISSDEEDDEILEPDFFDLPQGVVPQLIQLASFQDEIARVTNEVELFINQGIPKSQILILHSNWNGVDGIINSINSRIGFGSACDAKELDPGDFIRVTTLNAGTGLESPIVFIVGLNQLIEEEQSLRISDEERELVIKDNTRKIYMAITRAGQRLVLTYVGDLPDDIKWLF